MLAHPAVRGVVVTARDITERMQAEIALAEGRIMLEVALEAAQAGLWWLDLEADRLERNATTERLVEDGHAGPLVWSQWLTAHRPNLRAGILEWLAAMRAQPACWHEIEYRVNREDGSPRELSFRGRVLQTRDKSDCSRFAGTVVDVTEQRRLDEALRAAIDAEHERLGRELHDGLGQELVGLSLSTAG